MPRGAPGTQGCHDITSALVPGAVSVACLRTPPRDVEAKRELERQFQQKQIKEFGIRDATRRGPSVTASASASYDSEYEEGGEEIASPPRYRFAVKRRLQDAFASPPTVADDGRALKKRREKFR